MDFHTIWTGSMVTEGVATMLRLWPRFHIGANPTVISTQLLLAASLEHPKRIQTTRARASRNWEGMHVRLTCHTPWWPEKHILCAVHAPGSAPHGRLYLPQRNFFTIYQKAKVEHLLSRLLGNIAKHTSTFGVSRVSVSKPSRTVHTPGLRTQIVIAFDELIRRVLLT
jgi:hypothetical protein